MTTQVAISGLSELLRDLNTLPVRVERNVIRGALRAGARVMAQEVARRTPLGKPRKNWRGELRPGGDLLRSIKVRMRLIEGQPQATISVGSKLAWYVNIVERGTYRKPSGYPIVARTAKGLAIGGTKFVRRVWHPGIRGTEFVRRAFEGGSDRALNEFKSYLARRLPRELVKQQP